MEPLTILGIFVLGASEGWLIRVLSVRLRGIGRDGVVQKQ
jgi:hypothetical protein